MRKLLTLLLGLMLLLGITAAQADADLPSDLTVIEAAAFRNDTALSGMLKIPEGVTEIGDEAFAGCTGLTSLMLPDSLKKIGNGAFLGCTGLSGTLYFPADVFVDRYAFYATDIEVVMEPLDDFAFSPVSYFTHNQYMLGDQPIHALMYLRPLNVPVVRVPETIEGLPVEYIAAGAFGSVPQLRAVYLPDTLTMIDTSCFTDCPDLETVYVPASVTFIGSSCFKNSPKVNVIVERGSAAHWYCINNDIPYIVQGETEEITIWVREALVDLVTEKVNEYINPFAGYTVVVEPMGEGDAASYKEADPTSGADIFIVAQDQMARLVSTGAVSAVPDSGFTTRFGSSSLAAATVNGEVYAYPLTADNGYFMYYDRSVLSDPTSLEQIIKDCEAAGKNICFELNSGWYAASFFFAEGCTLEFGVRSDGSLSSITCDLASEKGVRALRNMIKLASSPAFVCGSSAFSASDIGMLVDGQWDEYTVMEMLGSNYAASKLPKVGGKQLIAFGGNKLLCVKPQTDELKAAMVNDLAAYIASAEMQAAFYDWVYMIPADLNAQKAMTGATPAENAMLAQFNNYAVPQGSFPGEYWSYMYELGNSIMAGEYNDYTDAQLLKVLSELQQNLANTVY